MLTVLSQSPAAQATGKCLARPTDQRQKLIELTRHQKRNLEKGSVREKHREEQAHAEGEQRQEGEDENTEQAE